MTFYHVLQSAGQVIKWKSSKNMFPAPVKRLLVAPLTITEIMPCYCVAKCYWGAQATQHSTFQIKIITNTKWWLLGPLDIIYVMILTSFRYKLAAAHFTQHTKVRHIIGVGGNLRRAKIQKRNHFKQHATTQWSEAKLGEHYFIHSCLWMCQRLCQSLQWNGILGTFLPWPHFYKF